MSSKDVVDVVYRPNLVFNHFLKDDLLFISYDTKINQNLDTLSLICKKEIFVVDGNDILKMLKAINKYSNYDISQIIEQIKHKLNWFRETYPEDYESTALHFSVDDFFYKEQN